ncbi:MAG: protein kinase [Hormoscilla sp. GM7CHS1pb]|nr:protein kinase [Hormoscilla sp. GM7CHS1pb]
MRETLLLDRYRILGDLGTGGFGETFLAEDTYMPSKRRCVIKRLKSIAGSPQIQQMVQQLFQREAAILEKLGQLSPQIPELYAYFQLADQFYLVQEWIDGLTLTDLVSSEGPLSETAVREILVSLLPVLTTVHSQGIVHRDIKPDNIILRRRDRQPAREMLAALQGADAAVSKLQSTVVISPSSRKSPILAAMGMIALWQTPYLQPPLPVTDPKPQSPSELPPIQQNVVATIPPVLPPRSVQTQRVSFEAGATGETLRGTVAPYQLQRYLLKCGQGQQFTLGVWQGNVNITVRDPEGQIIGAAMPGRTEWQGILPSTGDYVVEIFSPDGSDYAVRVNVSATIPPVLPPRSVQTQRVSFEAGATGETLWGTVAPYQLQRYLLECGQGQQFILKVWQGNVNITVRDPEWQIIGAVMPGQTGWQGILPSTGDYVVEISSPDGSDYAVEVAVL